MPSIPSQLLNSVVYLYPTVEDAQKGTAIGGTGFLIGVYAPDAKYVWRSRDMGDVAFWQKGRPSALYAVTVKHVVEDSTVLRLNTWDGRFEPFSTEPSAWKIHPTADLAICPIGLSSERHLFAFIPAHFILDVGAKHFDVRWGDNALFIGRFVTAEGKQRNTPTVRFGNVSMLPEEPIWNPSTEQMEDSFLVEARSWPGYSGSPVFVYEERVELNIDESAKNQHDHIGLDTATIAIDMWLLGINWAILQDTEPVTDRKGNQIGEMRVAVQTGMAGVVPSWKLWDLLEDKEVKAMREAELAAQAEAQLRGARPTGAQPEEESLTRAEFEDALQKATRKVKITPKRQRGRGKR